MKVTVNHPVHGEIVFEENFWTGKKKLSVNGKKLQKVGKKTFAGEGDKTFFLEGNFLTGNRLQAGNEEIVLTPALKWYEVVLSVLPFLLILIWGNSVALCSIVPVVGGAIGGGMGAIFGMTNVMLIKSVKFGHYRTDVFGGISHRTGSAFRVLICREPMSDNKGLLLYFYLKKPSVEKGGFLFGGRGYEFFGF